MTTQQPQDGIYSFSLPLLDGQTVSLAGFRQRVLLLVNTASECGFTPQYEGLEQLYRTYKERGLTVLAFPCNQFGGQEPGTSEQIAYFCRCSYGVSFPVFARIEVNGHGAHPLYQYLTAQRRGILGTRRIKWNFTKFLVDRNGRVMARYAPTTKPEALTAAIERLLTEPAA